ncbi:uncharacterized protein [Panulirus ornatus]|uniref:uncharacterized protein isoform X2 n=1 Tax=Panulirus ornatus TaxID=150431 RepID=UPI003A893D1B
MPRLRLLLTCVATLLLPALTSAITVNHSSGYQQDGQSNSSSEDFTNSSQVWHGSGLATDGGAEGSVLGIALGSLWERVRPYIFQDTAKLADRLTAFRQRMLTKAEDAVNVYTSAAATRFPVPGRQRFARRLESVGDATSEGGWTRQRVKREALHDIFNYKDPDGLPILSKIEGLLDLGVRGSRSIEMTQWNGRLIVAVIDAAMNVSIYAVDEQIRQVHHTARLKGDHKCDFCRVGLGRLLLVCITVGEPDPYQGFFSGEDTLDEVTVYLVDEEAPGQGRLHLNFLQTIPTPSPRYVDIWTQQHKTYLAVINAEVTVTNGMSGGHAGYGTYKNYHTTSRLYRWTGLYFDIVQELPGTNPRAVHYFIASKFFFLAVANFRNNKGQHNCDSVIYRYSVDMNRYVPFQQILTKGATHFESFTLGVDPRKNTFLAVANFCEDDEFGNCNPYTTSRIYQYHLGKFVLFQEIPTNHAIQWLAVQVEDTVLLAVASSVTGIKFYQYNGWRFTPTELQRAEGPFGVGVTSMSAVTWNGVVIMGVSNEDDGRSSNEPTLYTISFRTDKTLQEFYEATEKRCQDLLKGAREQGCRHSSQQLETNPMITGPHAFTVPVVIKGNLTVLSPSEVSQVHVRSTGELFPATLHGVQQKIEALEQELGGAWRRFVNTIPINSPITWPDDLHFSHLIIGSAGVSSVSDLRAVRVNGQLIPAVDDLVRLEELE